MYVCIYSPKYPILPSIANVNFRNICIPLNIVYNMWNERRERKFYFVVTVVCFAPKNQHWIPVRARPSQRSIEKEESLIGFVMFVSQFSPLFSFLFLVHTAFFISLAQNWLKRISNGWLISHTVIRCSTLIPKRFWANFWFSKSIAMAFH